MFSDGVLLTTTCPCSSSSTTALVGGSGLILQRAVSTKQVAAQTSLEALGFEVRNATLVPVFVLCIRFVNFYFAVSVFYILMGRIS